MYRPFLRADFLKRNLFHRSYKFIAPDSKFTKDQKDFYEQNGYILFKNNVSHELLDKCSQRFLDIAEGRRKMTGLDVLRIVKDPVLKKKGATGQYLISKIQGIDDDDILGEYCTCESVVDVVQNVIGPNITSIHSIVNNKPPDSHPDFSKHPMHQDISYFPFGPPDRIVGSWTAIESATVDNGCLFVIPGSHTSPLYEHTYPEKNKNYLYHGIQGMDHLPKVDLIMEKGDTVFFHPLLLHGSYPNTSKHFRKSISCHYADSNCHFINMENTQYERIAKEVEDFIFKQSNFRISFVDYWKLKCRLVRGPTGEFQRLDNHP